MSFSRRNPRMNRGRVASAGAAFVPSLLPSCVWYVDGNDLLSLGNGASISSWGKLQQFTGASNLPTVSATGYNGLPGARFTAGSSQMLTGPAAAVIGAGNKQPFTIVASFQLVTLAGTICSFGRTNTTSSIIRLSLLGGTNWGPVKVDDAASTVSNGGSAGDTKPHVISTILTSDATPLASQWTDGIADFLKVSFAGPGQTTLDEAALGCAFTNGVKNLFFDGILRRAAGFNIALVDSDRAQVESWSNA